MLTTIALFLQRAIIQGVPLLFGSTGEIITEKSGNLNLGIPGIMYMGGISGVVGAFFYERSTTSPNAFLAVLIPFLSALIGAAFLSLIYSFLTITLRANQNVTGLALTLSLIHIYVSTALRSAATIGFRLYLLLAGRLTGQSVFLFCG